MSTLEAPDILKEQHRPYTGKRLSKAPLAIAFGVFFSVMAVVLYTVQSKSTPKTQTMTADENPEKAKSPAVAENDMFRNAPQDGAIPAYITPVAADPVELDPLPPKETTDFPSDGSVSQFSDSDTQFDAVSDERKRKWDEYLRRQQDIARDREAKMKTALEAPTTVTNTSGSRGGNIRITSNAFSGGSGGAMPPATAEDIQHMLSGGNISGASAGSGSNTGQGGLFGGSSGTHTDTLRGAIANSGPENTGHYLFNKREPALAPNELKQGTVIPGTMLTGINSQLAGSMTALVRENVYDTVTGNLTLIPQGSRLIGRYDSEVVYGQNRLLIAWQRIIYPDGSSIDIGNMAGSDPSGYSGFKDSVNNHYMKTFGNSLLVSLFSAGIQLSQPQAVNGDNLNNSQVVAGSVGQQLGELGMEYARRGLSVPPTIEIRPGYRFNILVRKDMIIEPWSN